MLNRVAFGELYLMKNVPNEEFEGNKELAKLVTWFENQPVKKDIYVTANHNLGNMMLYCVDQKDVAAREKILQQQNFDAGPYVENKFKLKWAGGSTVEQLVASFVCLGGTNGAMGGHANRLVEKLGAYQTAIKSVLSKYQANPK
jgi:hypothetical protein